MRTVFLISGLLLFHSCANIGTLGGGKVDEEPPKIVNSNITRTNFTSRKIILEFNEYVTLNNAEKNISIQPRHSTMKFTISRKKIIIHLDSALKSNTTYNLIINKGITDYNANNTFSYTSTFSTGNNIDTGKITVRIKGYKDHKYLKVALSLNDGSDSFKFFRSDYIFDANQDIIQFEGLNNDNYHVWLFTDANNDNKPDWYKPVNFIKNPARDSIYELEPAMWNEPFRLKKALQYNTFLKLKYTPTQSPVKELNNLFNALKPEYLYIDTDSALINMSGIQTEILSRIQVRPDSIPTLNTSKEIREMVEHSIVIIKLRNEYLMQFTKPNYYTESRTITPNKESVIKSRKLDSFLLFPKNNTTTKPDTFYIKNIPVIDYKTLALFNLEIKNNNGKQYDIVIIKDQKVVIKKYQADEYENYLQPGIYTIQIYESSSDHIFDPFNLYPSAKRLYEKEVVLKANWEEVLNVVLD